MNRLVPSLNRLRSDRRGISTLEVVSTLFIIGGVLMVTNAFYDQPFKATLNSARAALGQAWK